MQRTGSFRVSVKTILLLSLVAVLSLGAIAIINSRSATVNADGQMGSGGRDGHTGGGGRGVIGDASFDKFSTADNVTKAVRDASQTQFRVEIGSMDDRAKAAKLGTIVQDYGSFVIVSSKSRSLSAKAGVTAERMATTINLPGKTFDPVKDGSEALRADSIPAGKDYYILQFAGTVKDEWIESLRSVGVEFLQYLPHNAYHVYGDGNAIGKALEHSRVRWVGIQDPATKLTDGLREQLVSDQMTPALRKGVSNLEMTGKDTALFHVAVFDRADLNEVAQRIANENGAVIKSMSDTSSHYFNVMVVEMSLSEVTKLANLPDIVTVEPYNTPRIEDERAAHIVAGNYTGPTTISGPGYNPLTQFGVNGTGVTIGMVDDGVSIPGNGGFYITSTNTVDGPLHGTTAGASGGHGHINASIISGDAPFGNLDVTGHNYGLGVAPKSNIINVPFLKGGTWTDQDTVNDTILTSGPNGVKGSITNNSWGAGTGGSGNPYTLRASQFDGFARDGSTAASIDPIMIIFSSGNQGTSGMTQPKSAKNVITVGNSENLRPELSASANNMEDLASGSSRGPATDGRIKPDITAPGTVITGSRAGTSCGSVSSCFEANHSWSSGTSHAAPQIAGIAALFTQFWKNNNGGVNPSVALIKAAILQSGQEMTGANVTTSIPNGNEGWGRANMKFMLNTGVDMMYQNETHTFSAAGQQVVYTGLVDDATKPIRVTLVWTDPPGAANANPALVNNLNLEVTVGANTYRGNVFASGLSTTGGAADNINNVEHVWLPAGTAAGTPITVTVTSSAINGDGVLGNADTTDQSFALVAYNYAPNTIPNDAKNSDFDGDGRADISVWRPDTGVWYVLKSSDSTVTANAFGASGDRIAPGDYDFDSKTDMAVFRPSTGTWYVQRSTAGLMVQAFGSPGDVPVQGDFDGDGKSDIAVFRDSTGVWYINASTAGFSAAAFGASGDKPVQGDYDGDGKADIGVWRPSTGTWYLNRSTAGLAINNFGSTGDRPVQADYDGDGNYDMAVWRPSTGTWYMLQSTAGFAANNFGLTGDVPAPADFDGELKADLGIFRPSGGTWYLLQSNLGFAATNFGANGDVPVPSGYIPQ